MNLSLYVERMKQTCRSPGRAHWMSHVCRIAPLAHGNRLHWSLQHLLPLARISPFLPAGCIAVVLIAVVLFPCSRFP